MATETASRLGPMETHVRIAGILFIAFGALAGMAVLGVAMVTGAAVPFMGPFEGGIIGFLLLVGLAVAALDVAAGIGILQVAAWGRTLGFVAAVLSLFSFPFGTALGIYALWILTRPEVERAFQPVGAG